MPKILQVADLHLDATLDYLPREKRESRNIQLENTFVKIVELALAEKVEIFLVTGDLFESNKSGRRAINLVNQQFAKLLQAKTKILLLPGSHDYWGEQSVYKKIIQDPGIHIFTQPAWKELFFPEYQLNFYGYPVWEGANSSDRILSRLKKVEREGLHIALLHGSLESLSLGEDNCYPFSFQELEDSGLDYLALGHCHQCWLKEQGVKVGCPGSPEGLNFEEIGQRYVLLLKVKEREIKAEKIEINNQTLEQIMIDTEEFSEIEEIREIIMKKSRPNLLLQVLLQGHHLEELNLDLDELMGTLKKRFFYLDIQDRTIINDHHLDDDHGQTIKGRFLQLMKEKISATTNEREKKKFELALSLGLQALLGGDKGC